MARQRFSRFLAGSVFWRTSPRLPQASATWIIYLPRLHWVPNSLPFPQRF